MNTIKIEQQDKSNFPKKINSKGVCDDIILGI